MRRFRISNDYKHKGLSLTPMVDSNSYVVSKLKEELHALQETYSYVGEVVKIMGKSRVLVKLSHEGKYVVNLDKSIKIEEITPNLRVAVRSDTYLLHKILPTKVDPLVSLMKV